MRRCGCCRSCSTIVRCPTGHAPAVARKRAAQPRALRRGVHKLHRHSVVSAGRRHASNFRPTDALPHLLLWPRLETESHFSALSFPPTSPLPNCTRFLLSHHPQRSHHLRAAHREQPRWPKRWYLLTVRACFAEASNRPAAYYSNSPLLRTLPVCDTVDST